jgi:hypothetical protein
MQYAIVMRMPISVEDNQQSTKTDCLTSPSAEEGSVVLKPSLIPVVRKHWNKERLVGSTKSMTLYGVLGTSFITIFVIYRFFSFQEREIDVDWCARDLLHVF